MFKERIILSKGQKEIYPTNINRDLKYVFSTTSAVEGEIFIKTVETISKVSSSRNESYVYLGDGCSVRLGR